MKYITYSKNTNDIYVKMTKSNILFPSTQFNKFEHSNTIEDPFVLRWDLNTIQGVKDILKFVHISTIYCLCSIFYFIAVRTLNMISTRNRILNAQYLKLLTVVLLTVGIMYMSSRSVELSHLALLKLCAHWLATPHVRNLFEQYTTGHIFWWF